MLLFKYRIGGVDYECSQDISALRGVVNATEVRVGFPCTVRYQPGNPQNSIVIAEGWTGLREGLPQLHSFEDPDPLDTSHLEPARTAEVRVGARYHSPGYTRAYACARCARGQGRKTDSLGTAHFAGGHAGVCCSHICRGAARPLAGAALRVGAQRLGFSGPAAELCSGLLPVAPRRPRQNLRLSASRRAGCVHQCGYAHRHLAVDRRRSRAPAQRSGRRRAPDHDDRGRGGRGDEWRNRSAACGAWLAM